jgi:DNA helicase-2/ATP-dependent DNA helicase PcrA
MTWNTGLTGTPLNIASYTGTPLRVMAGPGTGKTFSLMRRVARLLETGTPPVSILVVSFTRTAANDLIKNLNLLGSPGANQVIAKTLHSLSFTLLRQNAVFQATNRIPRPLIEFEEDCMVNDFSRDFGGKRATKELLRGFETSWATLQHQQPGWPQDPTQQEFHRRLMHWLIYHKAMLIGELVPRALDYVSQNPASPNIPRYSNILVDEYQDLNRADQALIDALAINGTLTVVGDEDQSIYTGLRNARPEGIVEFDQTHPNTHDEPLFDCRRCPSLPIMMANALVLHNHPQRPSTIRPVQGCSLGEVFIVQHYSIQDEVTTNAAFVDWPGDILILSTRRHIGNALRDQLVGLGHNALSFFSEDCLGKLSAKEGYCLLTMLVRPDDLPALRCWLGLGQNDWRSSAYQRIWREAESQWIPVRQLLDNILAGTFQPPAYTTELVDRYRELTVKINSLIGTSGTALIDMIWPPGDLDCADIRGIALTIAANSPTPSDILEELVSTISQPELPGERDDIIRIMSLHKSKGLTAKCVVVVGCVAGALPTISPGLSPIEQNQTIEEQRRLFYVAITRTSQTLVLSSAATAPFGESMQMGLPSIRRMGTNAVLQASPFMSELGNSVPATMSGNQWRTQLGF